MYGYGSYGEARLALLKGEVNVTGGDAFNYALVVEPLEKKGEVYMLFQSGLLDSKGNVVRHPVMPNARTVKEGYVELFGKEPSGTVWEAIKGIIAVNTLGKSVWAPPGVPEARIRDLEDGFRKMVADPAFQADAVKGDGRKERRRHRQGRARGAEAVLRPAGGSGQAVSLNPRGACLNRC